MKIGSSLHVPLFALLGVALVATVPMRAAEPPASNGPEVVTPLNPMQLDQLLGPIALYPDALVAIILPAATSPADIVLAARYVRAAGDPTKVDDQPWSDSVKALARYPDIVKWMDENLQWTKQVGEAFITQPADLMSAMQRLRARARATGALVSTPQQQVVVDGDTIEILPVQADVIYVPRYDPGVVYIMHEPGFIYPYGPYLSFGIGFPIGLWLSYDCDWRTRTIWVGDRRHDWREHREWRHQMPPNHASYPRNPNWRPWRPPENRPPLRDTFRYRPEIERPRPFPGAPITPRPPHPPRHDEDRNLNRPDTGAPRPPRTDGTAPRPPRTEGTSPRPPRTEISTPRPEHRNGPPANVTPRPPSESRPPTSNPSRPPNQSVTYPQRTYNPGPPPSGAAPVAVRPPPSAPPAVRNIGPSAPPPQPHAPPPAPPPPSARSRDPDPKDKQN